MSKRVTAPLVIAHREDGSDLYLYEGAVFPEDGLADGEDERLADYVEDEKSSASKSKK